MRKKMRIELDRQTLTFALLLLDTAKQNSFFDELDADLTTDGKVPLIHYPNIAEMVIKELESKLGV